MADFMDITVVMEMLTVNLIAVDLCSPRKYPLGRTIAVLVGFTVILTYLTRNLWGYMGFERGNALFSVLGIVYLIPLAFLYREPVRQLLSILFTAWLYTLLVYCFSVRVAYAFGGGSLVARILAVQSLVYTATVPVFLYWMKKGFLFILRNISQRNRYFLQVVSLCWFFCILIVHASLIDTESSLLKAAVVVSLILEAALSYLLIFSLVRSHREVRNLEDIVYIDALTGLFNRSRLYLDAEELMRRKQSFRLIFMDLNRFKSVNDQYGHLVGDQYLTAFARTTQSYLDQNDKMYRISGDEFVIVNRGAKEQLVRRLERYPNRLFGMDIPFAGCSFGWADYPKDGWALDELLKKADFLMYEQKSKRKKRELL